MPADASLPLRAAAWGRASQPISGALFLVGREILQLLLVLLIDPSSRLRQPLDEGAPVLHANGASSLHCLTSPSNGSWHLLCRPRLGASSLHCHW